MIQLDTFKAPLLQKMQKTIKLSGKIAVKV